jgi:ATP-dependent helicase/nuclease subunit A
MAFIEFENEKVVYSIQAPLILEASAGSGKTTILVERYFATIVYLIIFEKFHFYEAFQSVVALTFTRKAAGEMKDRIREKIEELDTDTIVSVIRKLSQMNQKSLDSESTPEKWAQYLAAKKENLQNALSFARIGTIHSFALSLLRNHPVETEVDPLASPPDESGIEGLSITEKDALARSIRSWLESKNPDFVFCVERIGYQLTEQQLNSIHHFGKDLGIERLEVILRDSGYLDCENDLHWEELIESKIIPVLKKILAELKSLEQTVRKNALPAIERTIKKIQDFLFSGEKAAVFTTDFEYDAESKAVEEAVLPYYRKLYFEMHRIFFPFLWRLAKNFYQVYQKMQREKKEIDFSDIEIKFLKALEKSKFREKVQNNIRFLLLDEYQDTSDTQKQIFDHLKGIPFIVGDPKQSIYGFRNANVALFEQTKKEFSEFSADSYQKLSRNYRSSPNFVDSINEIFADVFDQSPIIHYYPQQSFQKKETQESVFFIPSSGETAGEKFQNSCRTAANLIRNLVLSGEAKPSDVMVLTRKKTKISLLQNEFSDVLGDDSIPYFLVDTSNILESWEVSNLIIYLQALENPKSDFYFLPLLKSPFFRKTDAELLSLFRKNGNLYEGEKKDCSREIEIFEKIRGKKNRLSIAELTEEIVHSTGYYAFINSLPNKKELSTNLVVFLDFLRKIQSTEMFHLTHFLYYLQEYGAELSKPQVVGEKSDVVRIMTVHMAKGLESKMVIVIPDSGNVHQKEWIFGEEAGEKLTGFSLFGKDERFVSLSRAASIKELEEEKRLAYVAFTRAKERLYYVGVEEQKPNSWRDFIHLEKSFVQKRLFRDIPLVEKKIQPEETGISERVKKRVEFLESHEKEISAKSFPQAITITQLLDSEFSPSVFKNRYIRKSFPLDEALSDIAEIGDAASFVNPRADEGSFLHRVFQFADSVNFTDFIENHIALENELLIEQKGKIIEKAAHFFQSGFYHNFLANCVSDHREWEVNYPFDYNGKWLLIKGLLDRYVESSPKKGILIDYKLSLTGSEKRYERQLCYYAYILERMNIPVSRLFLYDIENAKEVEVKKSIQEIPAKMEENVVKIVELFIGAVN